MGADDYTEASRESWGAAAKRWAEAGEEPDKAASAAAGSWMLEAADLKPGQRVLELACGAGRVGLGAAELVAPGGEVLCSDFAEAMVEAVRGRAEKLGLDNVSARVLDAQALDLEEGEVFDRVLCRFGFMLMADPVQALRESARVLAPAGQLTLAVWGTAAENPWLAFILDALIAHFDAPPPEPGTPGPFALGDEARLREAIEAAGFRDVSITRLEVEQTYDSPQAWWDEVIAVGGPLAVALRALSDEDVAAIRQAALDSAQSHVDDDGAVAFPATVLGATARAA